MSPYNFLEKQLSERKQNVKCNYLDSATSRILLGRNNCLNMERCLHENDHCNAIYNSQIGEKINHETSGDINYSIGHQVTLRNNYKYIALKQGSNCGRSGEIRFIRHQLCYVRKREDSEMIPRFLTFGTGR